MARCLTWLVIITLVLIVWGFSYAGYRAGFESNAEWKIRHDRLFELYRKLDLEHDKLIAMLKEVGNENRLR